MRAPAIALSLLALAACAAPAVISDTSDTALRIEANNWTPAAEIDQKAQEGCGAYKKIPVSIGMRCLDGDCVRRELLFACKPMSGGFDGKWAGEGENDGCGSSWAMEIAVENGTAKGLLWRGRLEYNFEGRINGEGRLDKVLAGRMAASNGMVGPRFITVNAAFQGEAAQGDYSMPAPGVGTCVVSFNLSRHQT
jgi:hypothetical protein